MLDRTMEFKDLKDMLKQTGELYGEKVAFYLDGDTMENSRKVTHREFRQEIDNLGTALVEMGLKGKKIAVIGENRYEWEVAYLAIACGTGIVVPLDKALTDIEIESLIIRSEVEAIFYSAKYEEIMTHIRKQGNTKLKYFISMDLEKNELNKYSQKEITAKGKELLEGGSRDFVDSKINNEEMGIMLFTSGTTDKSKAVMLSHKNLCTNIMDIRASFDLEEGDKFLSFLPLHHTFECTVGFLYPMSIGATIVFSKGVRHIVSELKNFKIEAIILVPVVFEKMYEKLMKGIEEKGKLPTVKKGLKISNGLRKIGIDIRKKLFKEVLDNFGGNLKVMVAGGAALSPDTEKGLIDLGFNIMQGYGLTETSPVISSELTHKKRLGSVGKCFPHVEVKVDNPNEEGIGELLVKADSVMLGYYQNEEANKKVFTKDGWLRTGDLVKIDKDGYIFISGRSKFVIVLKNGKNVYPEEIESLVNKVDFIKESMVFGKASKDKDITISVKVVYDKELIMQNYGELSEDEIRELIWKKIKEINKSMPKYKYIKKLYVTDQEMQKTTTLKIKRKEEISNVS